MAKLYDELGHKEKAVAMAKEILNMEVKIASTAVEQIKDEMESILENTTYKYQ